MLSYKTLSNPAQATIIEKKSRFVAFARPISSEEEAKAFLQQLRKEYWDASHHVYAYILRESVQDGVRSRSTDDGEPSGSAGAPVLETLAGAGVIDAIVVVIRYFGGTLLGVGGLIRAYSGAAKAVIKKAGIAEMKLCRRYSLEIGYAGWNRVKHMASGYRVVNIEYGERITVWMLVEVPDVRDFETLITDATGGLAANDVILTNMGDVFSRIMGTSPSGLTSTVN